MECGLQVRVRGKLPLGDDPAAEAQGAEFENVAVPVVVMLECPDQHFQVPGVHGLAEQETVADEIVQVFLADFFSVAEIEAHLEKVKRLARPDFERVPIIDVHPETGAGGACAHAAQARSRIEPVPPGGQRDIERFFLIDLLGCDPVQFSLQEPAESPAGTDDRGRQFA